MFGLWDKNDKQTPSSPADPDTDPIVDEFAVLYKVGSLSDMTRVMGQEAQGITSAGPHFWEFEMKGIGLSPRPIMNFAGERKIASIHTHPLEPHLRNDPVAQFLMSTYGLSFEESSLLVSMNDIHHTLGTYAKGNSIAERKGLAAFNTHEATAGTVLLDEHHKVILCGLLPISKLPPDSRRQLLDAATAGIDEQAYQGMKPETMRKFYDVVIDFTVTNDAQAAFLFGTEGITHLIGARFAFGILDKDVVKVLREAGDLPGLPHLTYGRDNKGALFAVMMSTSTTQGGSSMRSVMAVPLHMTQPNQRLIETVSKNSCGDTRASRFKDFAPILHALLDAKRSALFPIETEEGILNVLQPEFMPSEHKGSAPIKIGAVGANHSVHMAEDIIAYAMNRNIMQMQKASD